jgi:hypothetical protein
MMTAARSLRSAFISDAGFFVSKLLPDMRSISHGRAFCVSNKGFPMPTNNPVLDEDDDDDDYEDYSDNGEFLSEDEWEDNPHARKLYDAMPKGWAMVKVVNFTHRTTSEMEEWLKTNCRADYERVGFRSGCSYNVAVQFEDTVDAIMFKLRWR